MRKRLIFRFRFETYLTAYYHLDTRKPMADAHHPAHLQVVYSSLGRRFAQAQVFRLG